MSEKPKQDEQEAPVEGGQPDRVQFSVDRKVSDGNYGSYDFHCSLSTDVRPGETEKEATKRAIDWTERVIKYQLKRVDKNEVGY